MQRQTVQPRDNWPKIVESQGLHYHTLDGVPYWDESACYELTSGEIDLIEKATYALNDMCLEAAEHVIRSGRFDEFQIPESFRPFLRESWDRDEHTIYGRFDFAFDGSGPPKLLEYNADTPTSLLEAAVIQWYWLQDRFPRANQFNSIHERLIEAWRGFKDDLPSPLYFASSEGHVEDYMTANYLRDVAIQAGLQTEYLPIDQMGWHDMRRVFTDTADRAIRGCFKLYPWEWMFRERFGPFLLRTDCRWLEPPWKALLSNKAILAVLWEMFPDSPLLLETGFHPPRHGNYVRKPIHGREGANIQIFRDGRLFLATDGPYDGPAVYQETWPLPRFDGRYFVCVGSWIVNGWACGIGLREDENLITGNLSRFVPHLFRG